VGANTHRSIVESIAAAVRLDRYLADRLPEHSRSRLQRAIEEGEVLVNGRPAKPSHKLEAGDIVTCAKLRETPPDENLTPEDIPLDIVYEDEFMMVINKPAGMVVHPAAGNRQGTLVNALLGRGGALSEAAGSFRPGIVHRLDKDTAGLMLVAKTDATHAKLARMIQERKVSRKYECIVVGSPQQDRFRVDAPIGRHPNDRKKMAIVADGRSATTDFEVTERLIGHAVLIATLHTGRTHQVRVHLASIGLPFLGDKVYGTKKADNRSVGSLDGQALRAFRLDLEHPITGHSLSLTADRPPDWIVILAALRGVESSGQDR
jgi:23S rRNA pseudouridine1911/1915/1917 synthase